MTLGAYRKEDGKIAITTNSGADSFVAHTEKGFTQVEIVENEAMLRSFRDSLDRLLNEGEKSA